MLAIGRIKALQCILPQYVGMPCWAMTTLMSPGGELLTITDEDMIRSRGSIRTKTEDDSDEEYSGPPVTIIANLTKKQSRRVLYHKLFRFLYNIGRRGVRIVLPSCCVTVIQQAYIDPSESASAEESIFES